MKSGREAFMAAHLLQMGQDVPLGEVLFYASPLGQDLMAEELYMRGVRDLIIEEMQRFLTPGNTSSFAQRVAVDRALDTLARAHNFGVTGRNKAWWREAVLNTLKLREVKNTPAA